MMFCWCYGADVYVCCHDVMVVMCRCGAMGVMVLWCYGGDK